jgi:hypothetical protein
MREQRIAFVVGSVAAFTLMGSSASAAELDWELGLATRYSNNINMSPDNEESEIALIPSGALSLLHEGPRLYADISGLVRYYEYTKNVNDNEAQYYADAVLRYSLINDFFDWRVENHLSNAPISIAEADTPNNRQNVNVFFTGPEFTLRLGSRNDLILGGGFIRTTAEETESFDSDRYVGKADFVHSVSSRIDVGISGEYEDVDFDNLIEAVSSDEFVDGDYDRVDYYATADLSRGANNLVLEAGYTDLDFVALPDDDGQRIYALFTREINERNEWTLLARDLFTDAARGVEGEPALGLGGVDVSADVYRVKEGAFSYEGAIGPLETALGVSLREEEYVNATLRSRDVDDILLDLAWPLTARMAFISTLSWAEYDYKRLRAQVGSSTRRNDKETYAVVGLQFQLRRRLELRTQVGWHDISSNDPFSEADELLAQLTLVWTSPRSGDAGGR